MTTEALLNLIYFQIRKTLMRTMKCRAKVIYISPLQLLLQSFLNHSPKT